MERIKIIVQIQEDGIVDCWETMSEIIAKEKKVIAAYLRALADSYDPPQKVLR